MWKKQFLMPQLIRKIGALVLIALLWPMGVRANEIQIQNLSDFSLSSYGTHTLNQTHLWENSDPDVVQKLLAHLADCSLKPAEKERLVRLLTADTGPFIWPSFQQSDVFLVWRMQTLFDVGAFEAVIQTIQSVTPAQRSPALSALLFDALLMNGQTREACTLLDEKEAMNQADERRIACLLAQEKVADARLQYELYKESKPAQTNWTHLADIVFQERALKPDFKQTVTPETIFLWILYGQVPLENQKDWVKVALARLKPSLLPASSVEKSASEKDFTRSDLLKIADMKPEKQWVYPMDMYRALGQAAAQERRGEAVLWALLLLSQSDFYRPEMTELMDDMMGEKNASNEQIH